MTLEQRLERLERQNRWMKRIGMLGLAVAAAVLLSGQAKAKDLQHLKVRSLTLIDAKGRNRVVLTDYGLRVSDLNGKTRAMLVARGDGSSGLHLYDKNGKNRATLGTLVDGSPRLLLYDKSGNARMSLGALNDGLSRLALYDKNGKTRAALRALGDGSPSLVLSDRDGNVRAELGGTTIVDKRTGAETKTAESSLTLFDAKGTVIWEAPR